MLAIHVFGRGNRECRRFGDHAWRQRSEQQDAVHVGVVAESGDVSTNASPKPQPAANGQSAPRELTLDLPPIRGGGVVRAADQSQCRRPARPFREGCRSCLHVGPDRFRHRAALEKSGWVLSRSPGQLAPGDRREPPPIGAHRLHPNLGRVRLCISPPGIGPRQEELPRTCRALATPSATPPVAAIGFRGDLARLDHLDDARLHLDVPDQTAAYQAAVFEEQALVVARRGVQLLQLSRSLTFSGVRPITRMREANRPVEYIGTSL